MSRFFVSLSPSQYGRAVGCRGQLVTGVTDRLPVFVLKKVLFVSDKNLQSLQKSINSYIFAILCQVNFEISLSYFHTKTIFNL